MKSPTKPKKIERERATEPPLSQHPSAAGSPSNFRAKVALFPPVFFCQHSSTDQSPCRVAVVVVVVVVLLSSLFFSNSHSQAWWWLLSSSSYPGKRREEDGRFTASKGLPSVHSAPTDAPIQGPSLLDEDEDEDDDTDDGMGGYESSHLSLPKLMLPREAMLECYIVVQYSSRLLLGRVISAGLSIVGRPSCRKKNHPPTERRIVVP